MQVPSRYCFDSNFNNNVISTLTLLLTLFTLVPLDYAIDLTLKRIYGDKDIETKISKIRKYLKNLLTLGTKNVHFTFGNNIYQQKDGVAMGSSLGPVLAITFMVHLQRIFTPELEKFIKP